MDRYDFERLNKIEHDYAEIPWDIRTLKEEAHREQMSFRDVQSSTPSGKRSVRPFLRTVSLQIEKIRRDRYVRDRLVKEKRQEIQKLERKEDDFNRVVEGRSHSSQGHKQHRSKRSMSALFSLMRPISTAFSLDSTAPPGPRRSASELDFKTMTMKPAFVLSMVEARVTVFINNERSFTFQLDTEDGGHYLLQALSRIDMTQWVNTINTTVRLHAQRRLTYIGNAAQQIALTENVQPRPATATKDPTAGTIFSIFSNRSTFSN